MTFLFDIGNVLLNLHFEKFHQAAFNKSQIDISHEMNSLKIQYETGLITTPEFIKNARQLIPQKLTSNQFIDSWNNIFSPNTPMWDLAQNLHDAHHTLILFSNTNQLHAEHFLNTYPQFSIFKHHHFSHEIGSMKPEPNFYHSAIEKYQLNPTETIYFDDLPENITTGDSIGFASHQYNAKDHRKALSWLSGKR